MKYTKLYTVVLTLAIFIRPGFGQLGMDDEIVKIKSYQSFDKSYPAGEVKIAIEAEVLKSWHINSDKPKDEFLIPTTLFISESPNFELVRIAYPEAHDIKLDFSETPISAWEGKIFFGALIKLADNTSPGVYNLIINIEYQACNNQSCLAPTVISDTLSIHVADKKDVVNEINQDIFKNIDLSITEITAANQENSDDSISNVLEENGILFGLIIVFKIPKTMAVIIKVVELLMCIPLKIVSTNHKAAALINKRKRIFLISVS